MNDELIIMGFNWITYSLLYLHNGLKPLQIIIGASLVLRLVKQYASNRYLLISSPNLSSFKKTNIP